MADDAPEPTPTQAELAAEQQAAKEQLQAILDSSRPKHLGYGITSGVGNIVSGAVGAVGVVVLAPTMGTAVGAKQGGVAGGAAGFLGGAVAGVVGGATVALGGAAQGIAQIVRGAKATPAAIIEPRRGKWWNDMEGKWILTNLDEEKKKLLDVPEDDDDILGEAKKDAEESTQSAAPSTTVADTSYYDALEVDPGEQPAKIKRQYYLLARKYHPDKVGKDDKASADKFKDIAEAYQVLSDPELRRKYDKEGKEGLTPDKTGVAGPAAVDPGMLFAFLFGSDKFGDYVGRLAMATSALVADSPAISPEDGRTLQRRRVARLAVKLAARLGIWAEKEDYDGAKATWASAAEDLGKASYGTELVRLIGRVYSLTAHQFMGSTDSGVGMPSIAKWTKGHLKKMEQSADTTKAKRDTLVAGMKMMTAQQTAQKELDEAQTEEEREEKRAAIEQEQLSGMLHVMWTQTVVDITTTLHEAAQMVLHDQGAAKEVRKRRADGLQHLGEIFMACTAPPESGSPEDDQRLYEEAAFAAMLETIKRKEEEAQTAHVG